MANIFSDIGSQVSSLGQLVFGSQPTNSANAANQTNAMFNKAQGAGALPGQTLASSFPSYNAFNASQSAPNNPLAATGGSDPANSAWSKTAVTQHPAAQNTNINPGTANQAQGGIDYTLHPGESIAAYTARISAAQTPTTPPAPSATSQTNSGAGTGGGLAPSGMEYNGQGLLVPIGSDSQMGTGTPQFPSTASGTTPTPATTPSDTSAQTNAIIQNLQNTGSQGSAGDATEQALQKQIQDLTTEIGIGQGNIMSRPEGLTFQTGQNAALLAQRNPELQALTNQLASLQANRQASIGANTSAAGASNTLQGLQQQNQAISPGQSLYNLYSGGNTGSVQPLGQVLNPAQSLVSPFTGSQMGNGNTSATAGVQSLAQQVASGQMSYQQAQSSLADSAQSPQLQQAISAINPSFNFQQSATNANIQGQIAPAAANATAQIQNLGQALQNIPALENSSVPILNTFTRLASSLTGIGGGGATALESARMDAIGAVTGALESANGMTPSAAGSLADSYFPSGLTQAQFESGMQQFQQQIAGKEKAFSNPGTVPQNAGTQSNSVIVGRFAYTKDAQGQWVAS